jgi:hypothetical protein
MLANKGFRSAAVTRARGPNERLVRIGYGLLTRTQ